MVDRGKCATSKNAQKVKVDQGHVKDPDWEELESWSNLESLELRINGGLSGRIRGWSIIGIKTCKMRDYKWK